MDKELCKELCKKMYGDYWAIKICIEKCEKNIKEYDVYRGVNHAD